MGRNYSDLDTPAWSAPRIRSVEGLALRWEADMPVLRRRTEARMRRNGKGKKGKATASLSLAVVMLYFFEFRLTEPTKMSFGDASARPAEANTHGT